MTDIRAENPRDDVPAEIAGKGSMAGMLAALTVLVLVAVAAFWLIGTTGTTAAAPGMTIAVAPGMTIAVEAAAPTKGEIPPHGATRMER